ncbi:septal ring lytic transglycosylase RlpA family protein [Pontibacter harenae]|uniref:septal ring lytic transglycosylase RlpA family protein n=1 Tax=Pontibacter harenae TaxID=2894083 RepID=UPI001E2F1CB5|nr:septal ring lytic transglycosylase RlpA family protein [Pontibacter harenae]MCC9167338.1 septal ring lytic transglycosylase RlpA family protein [Pontibacter harenae]
MNINRKCSIFTVILFFIIGISQSTFAQSEDIQKGQASWYGSKYHGKKTSSGERYNKNDMTAAHNTLPFGTKVKVTNLDNNETVVVRVNDRGPYVGDRIIDVSEVAAQKLGFHSQGVGTVKVEVLELPGNYDPQNAGFYTIQTGAYTDQKRAQQLSAKLKAFDKYLTVEVKEEQIKGRKIHRIRAGRFDNRKEAEAFNDLLKEAGLSGLVREA